MLIFLAVLEMSQQDCFPISSMDIKEDIEKMNIILDL